MSQLKTILRRLKNPSVVTSVVAQILTILMLVNVEVDHTLITTLVTAVCGTLSLMGIMSNPDTKNKGYIDDIQMCEHCNEKTSHVKVGNNLICEKCGKINPITKK